MWTTLPEVIQYTIGVAWYVTYKEVSLGFPSLPFCPENRDTNFSIKSNTSLPTKSLRDSEQTINGRQD